MIVAPRSGMTTKIRLFRVHEGPEGHLVAAEDEAQARGIAFGHRFADPDEWGEPTMAVEEIDEERASKIHVADEDGDHRVRASVMLAEQRAAGKPAYLAGTVV